MKPNPCKMCGKEIKLRVYGSETNGYVSFVCSCNSAVFVSSDTERDAILGWNAMNPERASDCPIESQEPVEQTCGNCFYFREQFCRRYAPTCLTFEAIPNMPQSAAEAVWPIVSASSWCGEWRAK